MLTHPSPDVPLLYLVVLEVFSLGQGVHEDTPGEPGELVPEGIVRELGCRETPTEGLETLNRAVVPLDIVKQVHRQEMVNTRVQAHLVHHYHALLGCPEGEAIVIHAFLS